MHSGRAHLGHCAGKFYAKNQINNLNFSHQIIVGACLAGLVIVVLVAYLIGRARAKRQGYASV